MYGQLDGVDVELESLKQQNTRIDMIQGAEALIKGVVCRLSPLIFTTGWPHSSGHALSELVMPPRARSHCSQSGQEQNWVYPAVAHRARRQVLFYVQIVTNRRVPQQQDYGIDFPVKFRGACDFFKLDSRILFIDGILPCT